METKVNKNKTGMVIFFSGFMSVNPNIRKSKFHVLCVNLSNLWFLFTKQPSNKNRIKNRILAKKPGMNGFGTTPEIDLPLAFNPYKHHLGFLKGKIDSWRMLPWHEVVADLRFIGNNLIDLYFGGLTIDMICGQCLVFAEQKNITSSVQLAEWIKPLEYRKTELSDKSVWIIRQGMDTERFLHIHPAKHSPLTLRVRANTLKTALAIEVLFKDRDLSGPELSYVNRVRKEYLGLSPIKMLEEGKGIAGLLTAIHDPLNY